MSEEVNTGGIRSIKYKRGETFELDEARKRDIDKGYMLAEERKKKAKIRNIVLVVILILVLLGLGIWFLI